MHFHLNHLHICCANRLALIDTISHFQGFYFCFVKLFSPQYPYIKENRQLRLAYWGTLLVNTLCIISSVFDVPVNCLVKFGQLVRNDFKTGSNLLKIDHNSTVNIGNIFWLSLGCYKILIMACLEITLISLVIWRICAWYLFLHYWRAVLTF